MLPQIYAEGVQWEHIDRPSFTKSTPVGHGEAGTVPRRGRWAALVCLSAVFPHRPRRSGTKLRMLDDMVCLPHPYPTPLPTPHSHPGPHWEKRREGGQEALGLGSR